jgi:hypothetical protein
MRMHNTCTAGLFLACFAPVCFAACTGDVETGAVGAGNTGNVEGSRDGVSSADNAARPEQDGELVGEGELELSGGVACRAACWALAGAECAAVGGACSGAAVITVGGVSIPCSIAVITACAAAGGGASVCSDWCTARYGQ